MRILTLHELFATINYVRRCCHICFQSACFEAGVIILTSQDVFFVCFHGRPASRPESNILKMLKKRLLPLKFTLIQRNNRIVRDERIIFLYRKKLRKTVHSSAKSLCFFVSFNTTSKSRAPGSCAAYATRPPGEGSRRRVNSGC